MSGSVLSGMPRCLMDVPAALNVMAVAWVRAYKVLQRADAHAAGLAALQPGSCRVNVQSDAAVQDGLCVGWRAGVHCGVICMEVQER